MSQRFDDLETIVAHALSWEEQLQKKIALIKPADLTAFAKKYLTDEGRTTLVFRRDSSY